MTTLKQACRNQIEMGQMMKCYGCLNRKDIHHFDIKGVNDTTGENIYWKKCIDCKRSDKEKKESKPKKVKVPQSSDETARKCTKCKQVKDLQEFPLKKQGGHYVACGVCRSK